MSCVRWVRPAACCKQLYLASCPGAHQIQESDRGEIQGYDEDHPAVVLRAERLAQHRAEQPIRSEDTDAASAAPDAAAAAADAAAAAAGLDW